MHVFAVVNQKGGVGKTTTSVNLAASLAAMHRRVLLIDLDAQGNATMGVGVDKHTLERSIYDVFIDDLPARSVITETSVAGLSLIGANSDLTGLELTLSERSDRETRLREALTVLQHEFDVVLVDCPPALNLLTLNALVAATGLLIPMQCEYYALEGLTALLETQSRIKEHLNPKLEIIGILRTMVDMRNSLTKDVTAQLHEYFGDQVFRTMIPRNVRLAEAPSHGLPALLYDAQSVGAKTYLALAGELIGRLSQAKPVSEPGDANVSREEQSMTSHNLMNEG
ncbi:MAG: ParA family protein [Gammaproteobacteria bacterium]